MHPAFVEHVEPGFYFHRRSSLLPVGIVSFFSATIGFQHPFDFRIYERPENVFDLIRVGLGPHFGNSLFNYLINIERVSPGINNITAGVVT